MLAVGDLMSKKGWHLNALNTPAALHIACTVSSGLSFYFVLLWFAMFGIPGYTLLIAFSLETSFFILHYVCVKRLLTDLIILVRIWHDPSIDRHVVSLSSTIDTHMHLNVVMMMMLLSLSLCPFRFSIT